MDERARGATDLIAAVHRAGQVFRAFGEAQSGTHQKVTTEYFSALGHATEPFATVGVALRLHTLDREVHLSVGLWVRDGGFTVQGDAMVDDPQPTRLGGGDQRWLRDLPDVQTSDLDEAIEALERFTAELCADESVLDDLGVPRT